jgi:glyceraldehyde 3-phosphate dehydrogenase
MKKIILYSEEPLVSIDVLGTTHSAIIDSQLTEVVSDDLVQVVAWYDNEWAYCCRLIEMAILAGTYK